MYERQPGVNVNPPQTYEVVNGGAPTYAPNYAPAIAPALRDKVHWGSVWAGLMTALTSFLVLQMFFTWIGVLGVNGPGAGSNVNAWLPPILALVAFFLGGWMAGGIVRYPSQSTAVLNGFLVWALGIVLILAFSAASASMAFGTIGQVFSAYGPSAHSTVNAINSTNFQAAAGWGLLFMILSAGAAALGGSTGGATGNPPANTIEPTR